MYVHSWQLKGKNSQYIFLIHNRCLIQYIFNFRSCFGAGEIVDRQAQSFGAVGKRWRRQEHSDLSFGQRTCLGPGEKCNFKLTVVCCST